MLQAFVHVVCTARSRLRALAIQLDPVLITTSKSPGVTCLQRVLVLSTFVRDFLFVLGLYHLRTTASTLVRKHQSGLLSWVNVAILTTLFHGSVKGMMCPSPRSTCLSTGMGVSSFVNSTTHCLYLPIPSRLPFAQ
jgi:hypothetical protein